MSKKKKSNKKQTKASQKPVSATSVEWNDRRPVLLFSGSFLLICLVFYLITNMAWFSSFRAPILSVYSEVSAFLLNLLGFGVTATGELLSSNDFSVSIEEGCDAIAPAILFVVSVAIFPISFHARWRGIILGLISIFILNIIRIISLFLTGIYVPSLFEFMHVDFWQAIFIVFTVGIWIYWMRWASELNNNTSTKSQ